MAKPASNSMQVCRRQDVTALRFNWISARRVIATCASSSSGSLTFIFLTSLCVEMFTFVPKSTNQEKRRCFCSLVNHSVFSLVFRVWMRHAEITRCTCHKNIVRFNTKQISSFGRQCRRWVDLLMFYARQFITIFTALGADDCSALDHFAVNRFLTMHHLFTFRWIRYRRMTM